MSSNVVALLFDDVAAGLTVVTWKTWPRLFILPSNHLWSIFFSIDPALALLLVTLILRLCLGLPLPSKFGACFGNRQTANHHYAKVNPTETTCNNHKNGNKHDTNNKNKESSAKTCCSKMDIMRAQRALLLESEEFVELDAEETVPIDMA